MKSHRKILVICAHPDDEVLGLGGTIHDRIKNQNCIADVLILGEGINSRNTQSQHIIDLKEHKKNSLQACKIIGYTNINFLMFPDNKFDQLPLLKVVKDVEKYISFSKPDEIFTHFEDDLNIDHLITSKAVTTATRPLPGEKKIDIFHFHTMSSSEWNFSSNSIPFKPNVFYEIKKNDIEIKQKALSAYTSEIRDWPHPRSLENIEVVAKYWGSVIGKHYAEAFKLVLSVN